MVLSNGLPEVDSGIIQLDVGEICGRRAVETASRCFPNLRPMNVYYAWPHGFVWNSTQILYHYCVL